MSKFINNSLSRYPANSQNSKVVQYFEFIFNIFLLSLLLLSSLFALFELKIEEYTFSSRVEIVRFRLQ